MVGRQHSTLALWLFSILLLFTGCESKSSQGQPTSEPEELTVDADTISQPTEEVAKSMIAYVAAQSGLNLRAGSGLKDKVMVKIPYGAKVEHLEKADDAECSVVEEIAGCMVETTFEGQTGYAFSGFLSPFPVPTGEVEDKYQYVRDYIALLNKEGFEADIQEPNSEASRMKVFLPNASIELGFLVMKGLFSIPNEYTLPEQGQSITYSTPESPSKAAQDGPYDYVTHRLIFNGIDGGGSDIEYYDDSEAGGRELTLSESNENGGSLEINLRTWTH